MSSRSSRRLPSLALLQTLALLGGALCAVAPAGKADLRTVPSVPPATVYLDVPPDVGAAIVVLRDACAAWRPVTLTVRPPGVSPPAINRLDAGPVGAATPLDAGPVAVSPPAVSPSAVSPLAARRVPTPVGLPYVSAARTICDVAANPTEAFFWPSMFLAGVAGVVLFFFGLVFFSLLHGLLISAWNWRPSFGEKSW